MKHYTYIIYSAKIDSYYVGSTKLAVSKRIYKHNIKHKGFTGRTNDWELVFSEVFESISQARSRESQIKKWKSRK